MKKISIAMLLGFTLIFTGCGSDDAEQEVVQEVKEVVEEVATHHATVNGIKLNVGEDITEDIINSLGEATEVLEAPSCHFDGMDTLYVFDSATLYVYKDGDKNILYIIEITGPGASTVDGANIDMTEEEVVALYGEDYEAYGVIMEYNIGDYKIAFSFDGDAVEYIEVFVD